MATINIKQIKGTDISQPPLRYYAVVVAGVIVTAKESFIAQQLDLPHTTLNNPCVIPSEVIVTAVGTAVCP